MVAKSDNNSGYSSCNEYGRCGSRSGHPRSKCPAISKNCLKCGIIGYFTRKCRNVTAQKPVTEVEQEELTNLFLGVIEVNEVSSKP